MKSIQRVFYVMRTALKFEMFFLQTSIIDPLLLNNIVADEEGSSTLEAIYGQVNGLMIAMPKEVYIFEDYHSSAEKK